jgi:hypothetical protein
MFARKRSRCALVGALALRCNSARTSACGFKPFFDQIVERSEIRGKVLGRDRALSRSAGQGAGVILRREEPGSGAHSTRPAACAQTPPAR